MAVGERDPESGHLTTGHEWDGITELNTPMPGAVYFFLAATLLFSVCYWVLMPAWPVGSTYTKGLLKADERKAVSASIADAARDRSVWTARIDASDFAEIRADPDLMAIVRETGRTLFGDNCAACHGREARGGKGFPDLTASARQWGGEPEAIAETIRVGINSEHPDTRLAQMPAFGRDGILPRGDVERVVAYVRVLSPPAETAVPADAPPAGKAVFDANCSACHGEAGRGSAEVGAPDLTDPSGVYGGDRQSVFTTVWGGRQGHMPAWEARLSAIDRKILTLFILDRQEPRR